MVIAKRTVTGRLSGSESGERQGAEQQSLSLHDCDLYRSAVRSLVSRSVLQYGLGPLKGVRGAVVATGGPKKSIETRAVGLTRRWKRRYIVMSGDFVIQSTACRKSGWRYRERI